MEVKEPGPKHDELRLVGLDNGHQSGAGVIFTEPPASSASRRQFGDAPLDQRTRSSSCTRSGPGISSGREALTAARAPSATPGRCRISCMGVMVAMYSRA